MNDEVSSGLLGHVESVHIRLSPRLKVVMDFLVVPVKNGNHGFPFSQFKYLCRSLCLISQEFLESFLAGCAMGHEVAANHVTSCCRRRHCNASHTLCPQSASPLDCLERLRQHLASNAPGAHANVTKTSLTLSSS
jgi:hypothetical protein